MTLLEVTALSEPQVGEQALPPMTRAQVTPELLESFCTVAFKVTEVAPAAMVVILFVMATEMGCTVLPELELEHPGKAARLKRVRTRKQKEDRPAKLRARTRMANLNR